MRVDVIKNGTRYLRMTFGLAKISMLYLNYLLKILSATYNIPKILRLPDFIYELIPVNFQIVFLVPSILPKNEQKIFRFVFLEEFKTLKCPFEIN